MAALILLVGLVLVVAAIRDTHGSLFSALGQDVPAFTVWAAAVLVIVALGFVPGLKTVSRGLLALVLVVLVLNNYQAIIAGFSSAGKAFATGPQSSGDAKQTSPLGDQSLSTLTSLLSQGNSSGGFGGTSGGSFGASAA